jgi:hypothetical protein
VSGASTPLAERNAFECTNPCGIYRKFLANNALLKRRRFTFLASFTLCNLFHNSVVAWQFNFSAPAHNARNLRKFAFVRHTSE